MPKFIDLTGKKIGRLTVIKQIGKINKQIRWLCKCDCGNYKEVFGYNLRRLHTTSCGCYCKEVNVNKFKSKNQNPSYKHGKSNTKIHSLWRGILDRCYNKNNTGYKNYGGRGITVCEEWLDKENGFINFYNWAIENGYDKNKNKKQQSIDRINVNGNYEPNNCRWVDIKTQANNKRTNYIIEYNGKKQNIKQWSEELNIPYNTLKARITNYHWSILKAFTTPIKKRGGVK